MEKGTVINVWTVKNPHKAAKCKQCSKKLMPNETIVGISRAQGSFTSVSNYHLVCAEPVLKEVMEETVSLMNQLVSVSEIVDAHNKAESVTQPK